MRGAISWICCAVSNITPAGAALNNGQLGVVQALGESWGNYESRPYIHLAGDDRSGAVSDGENIFINGDRFDEIDLMQDRQLAAGVKHALGEAADDDGRRRGVAGSDGGYCIQSGTIRHEIRRRFREIRHAQYGK